MRSSDLNDYFSGILSGRIYNRLKEEVINHNKLIQKKGASAPLYFTEDQSIKITNDNLKRLLKETKDGTISSVSLSYICDCLSMGENVHYAIEEVRDIIYEIADPEINGGYKSTDDLNELLARLERFN